MDDHDLDIRNHTYRAFVDLGRAPDPDEVAVRASARVGAPDVVASWSRLHDEHALVLDTTRTRIVMANPFSAVPTPHRVLATGRSWFANCAWDAFGIPAALHVDGRIDTCCPDCGDTLSFGVIDGEPGDTDLLFHCQVPASGWWDDIRFT
jgi:hypothetical protein